MKSKKYYEGMTMVEVIVVIGINTILLLALTSAVLYFYRTNYYTIEQAREVDIARKGIKQLVNDLKEMTLAEDGTWPLVTMNEHRIGFYSDIDEDSSVEFVEYELATTTVYKRIYNATGSPPVYDFNTVDQELILSNYVRNIEQGTSTFYYLDNYGDFSTSTTLLTDVRYIK